MQRIKKKRLISLVITLFMILTFVPPVSMLAFAADDEITTIEIDVTLPVGGESP